MKFTVSTQALLRELQMMSGVISTNTVLPILEDFLLQLKGNALRIFGSDLETSMSTVLQVEGAEDGEVAIPSRILLDTLKALPTQPLHFDINNDVYTVSITSATGTYNLSGESGEDFPNIPEPDGVKEIMIDAPLLSKAINKTLFAVSNDELRPSMTGVNVEFTENGTTFVGTDAHRLVKYTIKSLKSPEHTSFIVPRKAFGLLKNTLNQVSGDVKIAYNNTNAFFNVGDVELICRLIDAKYPDVNAVIPTDNPNLLTINRTDLEKALKRISIYASKTTYLVRLGMNGENLQLSAEDRDFSNEAQEKLTCNYTGDPMEIGFNSRFLAEVLGVMESDQVAMQLSTPSRAGVIVPTDSSEDEDLLMLVMPIMLNQTN